MRASECGVVNNEDIPGIYGGTHWVAYYNDPKYRTVEFFDSFGLPPAQEIESYLASSNKVIEYNASQIQDKNSVLCGHFCIYYIKERNKGKSPAEIINSLM